MEVAGPTAQTRSLLERDRTWEHCDAVGYVNLVEFEKTDVEVEPSQNQAVHSLKDDNWEGLKGSFGELEGHDEDPEDAGCKLEPLVGGHMLASEVVPVEEVAAVENRRAWSSEMVVVVVVEEENVVNATSVEEVGEEEEAAAAAAAAVEFGEKPHSVAASVVLDAPLLFLFSCWDSSVVAVVGAVGLVAAAVAVAEEEAAAVNEKVRRAAAAAAAVDVVAEVAGSGTRPHSTSAAVNLPREPSLMKLVTTQAIAQ